MARSLLRLMLPVAVILTCAAVSSAKKPNPNSFTGGFAVNVRGYWNGQGTAIVTQKTVQIQATVIDDGGNVGTLTTGTLPVVDGHFKGSGTVFGLPMTINGRVEAEDPPPANQPKGKGNGKDKNNPTDNGDQVLTDARIGATFTTTGTTVPNHGGRIAGGRNQ